MKIGNKRKHQINENKSNIIRNSGKTSSKNQRITKQRLRVLLINLGPQLLMSEIHHLVAIAILKLLKVSLKVIFVIIKLPENRGLLGLRRGNSLSPPMFKD